MTLDEYNSLKSIQATLENALVQETLHWMKEILSSGLISLDCLVKAGKEQHGTPEPTGRPCPDCNSNGVFKYSPVKDCKCGGKAWLLQS
jgi:hypothetical protein